MVRLRLASLPKVSCPPGQGGEGSIFWPVRLARNQNSQGRGLASSCVDSQCPTSRVFSRVHGLKTVGRLDTARGTHSVGGAARGLAGASPFVRQPAQCPKVGALPSVFPFDFR